MTTTSRLVPKTQTVELLGKQHTIRPFGFGQLPEVTAAILPLFTMFGAQEGGVRLDAILAQGGEGLMQILAKAARVPRDTLDELDYDEGKALLQAVIEVNQETFAKKVLPDLMAMMRAQAPAGTVGASLSTNLSQS